MKSSRKKPYAVGLALATAVALSAPLMMGAKYYSSRSDDTAGFVILFLLIAAAVLGAWIAALNLLTNLAKEKGYTGSIGLLWYIGLVATPFIVGIYVAALPDRGAQQQVKRDGPIFVNPKKDLPSV